MKKILGHLYFNIFKLLSPFLQFFVFLMIVAIPIDVFKNMFNNGFEPLLSLAWIIFILFIPKIAEKPIDPIEKEEEHNADV